jgi:hypothetical protein
MGEPSEKVVLGARLEALERSKARARQQEARKRESDIGEGKFPQPISKSSGRVDDKVGAALGISGKTYKKIKAVVKAAKEKT